MNPGVKMDYGGRVGEGTFNIGIGAMYEDAQPSTPAASGYRTGALDVALQGHVDPQKGGGTRYGGMLRLSVDL